MATFNTVEKLAANEAHREVRTARDRVRELLAEVPYGRSKSWQPLTAERYRSVMEEILPLLERAEGNIDVVLGRPRT